MANYDDFVQAFCVEYFDKVLRHQAHPVRLWLCRLARPTITEHIGDDKPIPLRLEVCSQQVPVIRCGWETMDEEDSWFIVRPDEAIIVVVIATAGDKVLVEGGVHDRCYSRWRFWRNELQVSL